MRPPQPSIALRRLRRSAVPIIPVIAVAFGLLLLVPTSGSARAAAAPVNTAEPDISGSAVAGQVLTTTTGTWTNNPTSFGFQWLRCPANGGEPDGSNCLPIPGATSTTYTLQAADVGFTIRVRVTAFNADGNASATSNPTAIVVAAASKPVNTAEPQISGSATQGTTLSATTGTWTNNPTSFAFQWLRCPQSGGGSDGSGCAVITGATANTYVLTAADVGSRIRVRVTATNAAGSTSAASDPTAIVVTAVSKPANTAEPKISGSTTQGQSLSATTGTWTNNPTNFAFQWLRCPQNGGGSDGSGCAVITGATANTHVLTAADVGSRIRVRVTATNAAGSTSAASDPTGVVKTPAPPPPVTGCPGGSGPVAVNDVKSPARLVIDRKQAFPSVITRGTQQLTLRFHVSACGRSVVGALVYVTALPYNQFTTAEQPTSADGWVQIDLRRLSAFPVSGRQTLLALFARARRSTDPLLAGISNRRLVAVRVKLSG